VSDDKLERQIDLGKKTDVGIAVIKGRVVLWWRQPMQEIVFEPQNAFDVAEALARQAHRARFPDEKMPEDFSYLAQQVKQRLTEDMRDRLQVRIATMLPSLLERKDLAYISRQLIDTIFSALDVESYTRLEPRGGVKYN
jgi:hypothetical protein